MAVSVPEGHQNGCGAEFNVTEAEKSGKFKSDDPLQAHYKKTGLFGSITGAFGDKKTMYCHHMTSNGEPAVRAAKSAGLKFKEADQVWEFLGKKPCCGRFAYDRSKGLLICGKVIKADHDKTCNPETCIFIANGLDCPVPQEALKEK